MGAESFRGDGPIHAIPGGPDDPAFVVRMLADRIEVLTVLVAAVDRWGELMQTISESDDDADAQQAVADLLGVSITDAQHALSLQIWRFTKSQRDKIRAELAECVSSQRLAQARL
ncbi:hypothetical protein [Rhodococcus sp. AW25M09]|uniref:hypothetical protein n=1 Tax=Rhodococcus sp. AW25M09 TaxID=1268303 RepID=UPI0005B351A5|nr:hypothetical protein [Rhodococcus sp. AW25M09]